MRWCGVWRGSVCQVYKRFPSIVTNLILFVTVSLFIVRVMTDLCRVCRPLVPPSCSGSHQWKLHKQRCPGYRLPLLQPCPSSPYTTKHRGSAESCLDVVTWLPSYSKLKPDWGTLQQRKLYLEYQLLTAGRLRKACVSLFSGECSCNNDDPESKQRKKLVQTS